MNRQGLQSETFLGERCTYSIFQQNEIATHISGGPPSMATNSGAADEISSLLQLAPITFL